MTSLAALGVALLVGAVATAQLRRGALARRLDDVPDHPRQVHARRVPRVGGLGLALGFSAGLAAAAAFGSPPSGAWPAFALAALLLGLVDDLQRPPAALRLALLAAIGLGTWWAGIRLGAVALPGAGPFELGWLDAPATALWVVGVMVAFNFIDGLDGLAVGLAGIAALGGLLLGTPAWVPVWAALLGALAGLLVFNRHPATAFLGDSGSNVLGYLVAAGILVSLRSGDGVFGFPALALLAVPLVDTSCTLLRRALLREGMFLSERGHIHHRRLDAGLPHGAAVVRLWLWGVPFVGLALAAAWFPPLALPLTLAAALGALGLVHAAGCLRPSDLRALAERGRANQARDERFAATCSELAARPGLGLGEAAAALVDSGAVQGARLSTPGGDFSWGESGGLEATFGPLTLCWAGRTSGPTGRERAAVASLLAGRG